MTTTLIIGILACICIYLIFLCGYLSDRNDRLLDVIDDYEKIADDYLSYLTRDISK